MTDDRPSRPRLSIVVALHRPGVLLPGFLERIDGLLADDTELVLVDDASQDGTAARLRAWARDRPRVRVLVNAANVGVAASRNRAVDEARGTWVWFADHDDAWEPDVTRRLLEATDDGVDVVVCRADYRTDPMRPGRVVDGLPVPRTTSGAEALGMLLDGTVDGFLWSKLVRRSVLCRDPFPHLPSQSDVAGIAPVLARARAVRFVPEVLYHWLYRPGSVSRSRRPSLHALEAAHTAVVTAATDLPALRDPWERRERLTWFSCWFRCRALVVTPGRQGAPWSIRRAGALRARALVRTHGLAGVRRRSRGLWLLLTAVRVAPRTVVLLLPVLFRLRDVAG